MMNGAGFALSQQQVMGGWAVLCVHFCNNVPAYFSSVVWEESGLITSQGVWPI